MCKIVYLTNRCFDRASINFRDALAQELRSREVDGKRVEVVTSSSCRIKQYFIEHKTYGIAIAIDFFNDGGDGCGLTLNKKCSFISRDFAYNLSNTLDLLTPSIRWRDFKFVDSYDKEWYKFFNKISASTKAILYLCTKNNRNDWENYQLAFNALVKGFADEIIRCLRSNYDYDKYTQSSKLAKLRARRMKQHGMD